MCIRDRSRYTRNLIVDNENHLLQSRDYFSGSMIDLFYSTSKVSFKDNPIFLSAALSFPFKGIDIENDSYQAFIDLNPSQKEAVNTVRQEMLELNAHVCHALEQKNITPIVHPPHLWAKNTGPSFDGNLNRFNHQEQGQVHVTFGDVVNVEGDEAFGILSGDDLVVRLAVELPRVQRLVFAIKGVDGILRLPPDVAKDNDLIENWHPDIEFEGTHQSQIDVTGGIGLKAARGALVASHEIDVVMVNGDYTERVLDAMLGNAVRGTRITAKQ